MAQLTVPRSRRLVIAMKPETTYGTDVLGGAYVAGDIVPAFSIRPRDTSEVIDNLTQGGQLGRLPAIIGRESAALTFDVNLRGRGVAYDDTPLVVPEADLCWRGCSLARTIDTTPGSEKVTYVPTDTHESMTIYAVQENGTAFKMAGCHGTFSVRMTSGGVAVASFSFVGRYAGESDVAFTAAALSTLQYPTFKSAAFQIGTENYAARLREVMVAQQNQLVPVPAANDATGLAGFIVGDRNPRLEMDPEAASLATYPWYTKWKNGTLADCTFAIGTAQYNRLKWTFNQLQILQRAWTERDGVTAFSTTLLAALAGGNDDFSLVYD